MTSLYSETAHPSQRGTSWLWNPSYASIPSSGRTTTPTIWGKIVSGPDRFLHFFVFFPFWSRTRGLTAQTSAAGNRQGCASTYSCGAPPVGDGMMQSAAPYVHQRSMLTTHLTWNRHGWRRKEGEEEWERISTDRSSRPTSLHSTEGLVATEYTRNGRPHLWSLRRKYGVVLTELSGATC